MQIDSDREVERRLRKRRKQRVCVKERRREKEKTYNIYVLQKYKNTRESPVPGRKPIEVSKNAPEDVSETLPRIFPMQLKSEQAVPV